MSFNQKNNQRSRGRAQTADKQEDQKPPLQNLHNQYSLSEDEYEDEGRQGRQINQKKYTEASNIASQYKVPRGTGKFFDIANNSRRSFVQRQMKPVRYVVSSDLFANVEPQPLQSQQQFERFSEIPNNPLVGENNWKKEQNTQTNELYKNTIIEDNSKSRKRTFNQFQNTTILTQPKKQMIQIQRKQQKGGQKEKNIIKSFTKISSSFYPANNVIQRQQKQKSKKMNKIKPTNQRQEVESNSERNVFSLNNDLSFQKKQSEINLGQLSNNQEVSQRIQQKKQKRNSQDPNIFEIINKNQNIMNQRPLEACIFESMKLFPPQKNYVIKYFQQFTINIQKIINQKLLPDLHPFGKVKVCDLVKQQPQTIQILKVMNKMNEYYSIVKQTIQKDKKLTEQKKKMPKIFIQRLLNVKEFYLKKQQVSKTINQVEKQTKITKEIYEKDIIPMSRAYFNNDKQFTFKDPGTNLLKLAESYYQKYQQLLDVLNFMDDQTSDEENFQYYEFVLNLVHYMQSIGMKLFEYEKKYKAILNSVFKNQTKKYIEISERAIDNVSEKICHFEKMKQIEQLVEKMELRNLQQRQ